MKFRLFLFLCILQSPISNHQLTMSDEIHMEAAWRHRDRAAVEQWHGLAPDEALMAAEDFSAGGGLPARAALLDGVLVYLFAGREIGCWQNVALRAHALMVHLTPWLLTGRGGQELPGLREAAGVNHAESLVASTEVCRGDEQGRETLGRLLAFLFPAEGRRWLKRGTQRAYLLARAYQPALVTDMGKELTFEDLARIFEGDALATRKDRDRARSRWSARAQEVLRKPIEAAGGTVRVQFSKSAGAREKMSRSAQGNRNRRNAPVLATADTKTPTP